MSWQFILAWFKIVVLDLTLAGDNAVVIAMAVRTLPSREQRAGIILGALGAVTVRVILTFAAAQLLVIPSLQFLGGLLLIWIAFKLLAQDGDDTVAVQGGTTLLRAIRIIIVADLIMSTDNILAVAGASDGSAVLLLLGLGLSIPIVVCGAAFVALLMNRYSWIVYVGAGILGEVAGKMITEDNFIGSTIGEASQQMEWAIRISLAIAIVVTGVVLAYRSKQTSFPGRDQST